MLATNPQGTYEVQRRQAEKLEGGDPQFIDFIDLKSRKIIFSFSSTWRSTDANWSPDGSSVFINDHVAILENHLYVLKIVDGHVVVLVSPGNEALPLSLAKQFVIAKKWLNNSSIKIEADQDPDQGYTIHVITLNPDGSVTTH